MGSRFARAGFRIGCFGKGYSRCVKGCACLDPLPPKDIDSPLFRASAWFALVCSLTPALGRSEDMPMCIRKHGYFYEFPTLHGAPEQCCINETPHPETAMPRKPARTNDAALAAFIAKKAEIDAMLARGYRPSARIILGQTPSGSIGPILAASNIRRTCRSRSAVLPLARASTSPDARARTDCPAPPRAGSGLVEADRSLRRR